MSKVSVPDFKVCRLHERAGSEGMSLGFHIEEVHPVIPGTHHQDPFLTIVDIIKGDSPTTKKCPAVRLIEFTDGDKVCYEIRGVNSMAESDFGLQ